MFLGRSMTQRQEVSDETSNLIDKEVRAIIDQTYATAKSILEEHIDTLHLMSDALMKYETIDEDQIAQIMKGNEPAPPKDWGDTPPVSPSPDSNVSRGNPSVHESSHKENRTSEENT